MTADHRPLTAKNTRYRTDYGGRRLAVGGLFLKERIEWKSPCEKLPKTTQGRGYGRRAMEEVIIYSSPVSKITSNVSSLLWPRNASRGSVPDFACPF